MPSAFAASLVLNKSGPSLLRCVGPITVVCSASMTSISELVVFQEPK